MPKRRLPSPRVLRRLIDYNPETGELKWKERPVWMFSDAGDGGRKATAAAWNTRFSGKAALAYVGKDPYPRGKLFGNAIKAHRVIWAISFGYWPTLIDHINGNHADNRLSNLREVTRSENSRNASRRTDNKSGFTGVCWVERIGAWQANIRINGRPKFLGNFANIDEAVAARKAAELQYGYHPNHGRQK